MSWGASYDPKRRTVALTLQIGKWFGSMGAASEVERAEKVVQRDCSLGQHFTSCCAVSSRFCQHVIVVAAVLKMATDSDVSLRPISLKPVGGFGASNPFASFGKGAGFGIKNVKKVCCPREKRPLVSFTIPQ